MDILSAEQTEKSLDWYQGTADAVRRNIIHFRKYPHDLILILSGDQLYRMDYRKIIEQQQGAFEPSEFVDHYEAALKALIEEKLKGHKPKAVAAPKDTNVVDLMSALHDGDWAAAESSTSSHRSHASGLVAAHLQWHLERGLRSLPLVERS